MLCDARDVELARFRLLEDANEAARRCGQRVTVYALKSGKAMSFTAPGGGTVRGRAARLNQEE